MSFGDSTETNDFNAYIRVNMSPAKVQRTITKKPRTKNRHQQQHTRVIGSRVPDLPGARLHPPTRSSELTGLHTVTRESNCPAASSSSSPSSPCPAVTTAARRCRALLPEGIPRVSNSSSMGPEPLSPTSTLGGAEGRGGGEILSYC